MTDEERRLRVDRVVAYLRKTFSDEERLTIFYSFCISCGDVEPDCQCSNDE